MNGRGPKQQLQPLAAVFDKTAAGGPGRSAQKDQIQLPLRSSILNAEELAQVERAMRRKQALQERAEQLRSERERFARELKKKQAAEELAALRARLEAMPRGPNLPPYKRRRWDLDVQWEDIADLLPEGWGSWWPEECERMGARLGVPPSVVPLMEILCWMYGVRAPRSGRGHAGTAGSFCASPEELAPVLGQDPRTVKRSIAVLDPYADYRRAVHWHGIKAAIAKRHGKEPAPPPEKPRGCGTVYAKRMPRIRLYLALQGDVPAAQRLPKWMDRGGKLHDWLTLRGVFYPTVTLVRALNRRAHRKHRPRPGKLPKLRRSPMREDLYRRLSPIYRRLKNRLAPRLISSATPNNVQLFEKEISSGRPARRGVYDSRPEALFWPPGAGPPPERGRSGHRPTAEAAPRDRHSQAPNP